MVPQVIQSCIAADCSMPAAPLSQFVVHLHPEDNIAVAAWNLKAGTQHQHDGDTLTLQQRIGLGHKIALRPIQKGEAISEYWERNSNVLTPKARAFAA
jgi:hypothetical protein